LPKAVRSGCNFAPFLRRVVFIGETALRAGLDFERIGLRAEGPP
jgi:hypothetical protein